MVNIGKNIKRLRHRIGLSQTELANKLGVTAQAVSKWERCVNSPDIALIPRIAELFDVSIDELFKE
jgi:transcriptional regulator with XRE-family HTH domain